MSDEDKTLALAAVNTGKNGNEPVPEFTASVDDAQTTVQNQPNTEPTKVLPADELDSDEPEEFAPDENALRPNRLRFALVCLFFAFVAGWNVINLVQQLSFVSHSPEWQVDWKDKRFTVTSVTPDFADQIKVGDELVSINNEPVNKRNIGIVHERIKPGGAIHFTTKARG